IFQKVRADFPNMRLIIVPRQRERFDEVAALLCKSGMPFVRRSELIASASHLVTQSPFHPIILVDTFGELGALWGLADIAFVGGSFDGRRGGQNMIEPAAYGAVVLFGPHTWNFRDTVRRLLESEAAIEVNESGELEAAVRRLIVDPVERQRLGASARPPIRPQQGATAATPDPLAAVT